MSTTVPLALMPSIRQQFLDDNGEPLVNGELRFYAVGTTTPKAVYANADGDVSLGTTVELDAGGFAPSVYLSPSGYKVQLWAGTTLVQEWSQDQVEDVGSAFLANLGQILAEGSKNAVSGYTVTNTDVWITMDDPTPGTQILNLQPAADRGLPLIVQNFGDVLRITPNGSETINGLATYLQLPAASSPDFPWALLVPSGSIGYLAIAGSGNP